MRDLCIVTSRRRPNPRSTMTSPLTKMPGVRRTRKSFQSPSPRTTRARKRICRSRKSKKVCQPIDCLYLSLSTTGNVFKMNQRRFSPSRSLSKRRKSGSMLLPDSNGGPGWDSSASDYLRYPSTSSVHSGGPGREVEEVLVKHKGTWRPLSKSKSKRPFSWQGRKPSQNRLKSLFKARRPLPCTTVTMSSCLTPGLTPLDATPSPRLLPSDACTRWTSKTSLPVFVALRLLRTSSAWISDTPSRDPDLGSITSFRQGPSVSPHRLQLRRDFRRALNSVRWRYLPWSLRSSFSWFASQLEEVSTCFSVSSSAMDAVAETSPFRIPSGKAAEFLSQSMHSFRSGRVFWSQPP
jgi:hypothetical protein